MRGNKSPCTPSDVSSAGHQAERCSVIYSQVTVTNHSHSAKPTGATPPKPLSRTCWWQTGEPQTPRRSLPTPRPPGRSLTPRPSAVLPHATVHAPGNTAITLQLHQFLPTAPDRSCTPARAATARPQGAAVRVMRLRHSAGTLITSCSRHGDQAAPAAQPRRAARCRCLERGARSPAVPFWQAGTSRLHKVLSFLIKFRCHFFLLENWIRPHFR